MLYLDYETRSRTDIKAGAYRYCEDPDFYPLMCAYALDDEPVRVAFGPEEILAIPGLLDPEVTKVAHNAQFERAVTARIAGRPTPPEEWYDTMAVGAERGYPRSLKELAKALGAEEKDEAGTRLINLFCKPVSVGKRKGEWNSAADRPDEWLDFIAYCVQDVETLRDVYLRLEAEGGWPTEHERLLWNADQRINDRGIRIDRDLAVAAVAAGSGSPVVLKEEAEILAGIANAGSVAQIKAFLEESGVEVPSLSAGDVSEVLSRPGLDPAVRRVLEIRQELAFSAPKKFGTAAEYASPSDDRLRGSLAFYGAHTGRWAGRGVQLQNLPREAFKDAASQEAAIEDVLEGRPVSSLTLKRLVRPLFVGPFTVVDYSAIEARVLAWLAHEKWVLDAFASGRDIYVETAKRMGGLTRQQGKVAVLALGYNGGVNSLKAMGGATIAYDPATGEAVRGPEAAEYPQREMTDEEYMGLVSDWRRANPKIVTLWKSVEQGFGSGGPAGRLRFEHIWLRNRLTVRMILPSGRALQYHDVRRERVRKSVQAYDPDGNPLFLPDGSPAMKKVEKEAWTFRDPGVYGRVSTYGGRLTENATQAVARDILGEALVRLDRDGYDVVGHVHDEVLVEGAHDVETIANRMCELPSWATGLPLNGEGFQTNRYSKEALQ